MKGKHRLGKVRGDATGCLVLNLVKTVRALTLPGLEVRSPLQTSLFMKLIKESTHSSINPRLSNFFLVLLSVEDVKPYKTVAVFMGNTNKI